MKSMFCRVRGGSGAHPCGVMVPATVSAEQVPFALQYTLPGARAEFTSNLCVACSKAMLWSASFPLH